MEKFTLILGDGKTITGSINGNNYITTQTVEPEDLDEMNLVGATLNGEPLDGMRCCNLWTQADGTHMIFIPITDEEWKIRELTAQIEYLAMMTEVEL